jgi:hypothetical protein
MGQDELKAQFDELAGKLWAVRAELAQLSLKLSRTDDLKASHAILTDLAWDCENCTVIGLHQIGLALEDDMGTGCEA